MDSVFRKKVQTAAVAGWLTILFAVVFLIIQWIAYLLVMEARPAWIESLWGPGITWPVIQVVWFGAAAVFKVILWVIILLVLWLTLWARKLKSIE
jgi:hypothetical protein